MAESKDFEKIKARRMTNHYLKGTAESKDFEKIKARRMTNHYLKGTADMQKKKKKGTAKSKITANGTKERKEKARQKFYAQEL